MSNCYQTLIAKVSGLRACTGILSRCLAIFVVLYSSLPSYGAYTETAPKGVFVVDNNILHAIIDGHWRDDGTLGPLLDPIVRYEPGGAYQGTLISEAEAGFTALISMLLYGVNDSLSVFLAIPLILKTTVDPKLSWTPGDYSPQLGRAYSEEDFWEWAGSMGQPKPAYWEGNRNTLGDIVLGFRWRFSDLIDDMPEGLALALHVFGSLPTGTPADPEEIVSVGTQSWAIHAQGEIGFHLSTDYRFAGLLDGRVNLGLDVFYEAFLTRSYKSSTGSIHPLLLNHRPYVGEYYQISPGDLAGFETTLEIVAIRGPVRDNWLTRRAPDIAESGANLLALAVSYGFTGVRQSYWHSNSVIWNWDNESFWAPGYKNILEISAQSSLLRLGIPLDLAIKTRSQTLLPGKNVRAPNLYYVGGRIPLKFW